MDETIKKEMTKKLKSILISGSKEDLIDSLSDLSDSDKRELLIDSFVELSNLLVDPKLNNVYSRPGLNYIIKDAINSGNDAHVVFIDQCGLGTINREKGQEAGDKALEACLHSINTAIKQDGIKARVIRTGGDEFVIVVEDENEKSIEATIQKAQTIARDEIVKVNGEKIDAPIKFVYGISKLDENKSIRRIIDEAQTKQAKISKAENDAKEIDEAKTIDNNQAEYYQERISKAESDAEDRKSAVRDIAKEIKKQKAIDAYIDKITEFQKNGQKFDYEVLQQKEYFNQQSTDSKVQKMDLDFIIQLSKVATSNNLMKSALISQLNNFETEKLIDNFYGFGESYVREGNAGCIKKSALNILDETVQIGPTTKTAYIEVDNLKLVNSALSHQGGDKYIGDFMKIVNDSIANRKDQSKECYIIKVSGNALVLVYDESNADMIDEIKNVAKQYNDPNINIPMNVYSTSMEIENFEENAFNDEVKEASGDIDRLKNGVNEEIEKIIVAENGVQVFTNRETPSYKEIENRAKEMIGDDELVNLVDGLVEEYNNSKELFEALDNAFNNDEYLDYYDQIVKYVSVCLHEKEITKEIEKSNEKEITKGILNSTQDGVDNNINNINNGPDLDD